MKTYKSLVLLFILPFIFSCNISESATDNYFYFNSFESGQDTIGWDELNSSMIVKDHSPEGGRSSLLIGGGCLQPAGKKEFTVIEEGYYVLECMGKTKTNGGSICLLTGDPTIEHSEIVQRCLQIKWTSYTSNEVFCKADSKLLLEIYAGGFIPSDVYIDELKIKKL